MKKTFKNLSKKKKPWTRQDKNYLKKNAGNMSDANLGKRLNRTEKSIREMRYRMDIKKKSGRGIIELE